MKLSGITFATQGTSIEKKPLQFTADDQFGAHIFHAEFVRALIRHEVFEQYHLYDFRLPERAKPGSRDAELKSNGASISFHSVLELPYLASNHRYIFFTGGPDLITLARARQALNLKYPICSVIHSTLWAELSTFISGSSYSFASMRSAFDH